MAWNRVVFGAALLAAACWLGGGSARAATLYQLGNHPANPGDDPFGLIIEDANGVNTFDFENNGASVFFEITGPDSATISGTIYHSQSGQLWSLTANLSGVLTTNKDDGGVEPWFDPALADSLYDGILEDMILFGDTVNGDGGANLKQLAFEADRITFYVDDVLLEFLGPDPATAVFDPDGNADGVAEFLGYPNGDPSMVSMVVAKGHYLGPDSDQLAGLGWLVEPGEEQPAYQRDFSFVFGAPVPEPSAAALFAAGSLLCRMGLRRRRA